MPPERIESNQGKTAIVRTTGQLSYKSIITGIFIYYSIIHLTNCFCSITRSNQLVDQFDNNTIRNCTYFKYEESSTVVVVVLLK
jgi:hypothetical protein